MHRPQNKFRTLLCLLLMSSSLWAQHPTFGRTYQENLPENYKLSITELRNHMLEGLPNTGNLNNYERQALRFSDRNAISITALMESGQIYSDWPAMDNYLNDVLQRIIPKEMAEEQMIRAFLVKNGNFNAYMTAAGHMFINVGVFSLIEDEATLASIMAHEIGHYYLKHGFETFTKAESKVFDFRLMGRKEDFYQFSVTNELDCDSLAFNWLQDAGYNFNGVIQTMQILEKLEENQLMKYKDVWEIKKSTHPRGEKRVSKLKEYASQITTDTLPNFLVSEQVFNQLRKEAKTEILKHLLHKFQYTDCIEVAFRFHLEDVKNTSFLYYLMEAIRRLGMLDNSHWEKKFITHQYYLVEGENEKKVKINKHIFEDFFTDILLLNKSKLSALPSRFYWEGDPKFVTNEEAFEYFAYLGELLNEPECILSNALSVYFDKESYQPLLKQYLGFKDIRFRDFAQQMLNGTLRSSLPDNSIALLTDFSPFVKQGDEIIYLRDENGQDYKTFLKEQFAPAFSDYSNFIYLPNLLDNQLNNYSILKEMAEYSQLTILAKGHRINPHILDPRFWEVMKQFNANEFDFFRLDFRDVERNIKTLASYHNVLNFNTKSYLEAVKRDRYVTVGIFSMRIKQNNFPKIIHFSDQENLKFREPIFPQLTEFIKKEIAFKVKTAKELDDPAKKVED